MFEGVIIKCHENNLHSCTCIWNIMCFFSWPQELFSNIELWFIMIYSILLSIWKADWALLDFTLLFSRWLPETNEIVKYLKDKIDAKIKLKRPEYTTTGKQVEQF